MSFVFPSASSARGSAAAVLWQVGPYSFLRRSLTLIALLALFGCSHSSSQPVRGTPMRGQQEGPLHGVPEEEAVVEQNIAPPPYPAESKLIELRLRGLTSNRFFIDSSSLSVAKDKIIRFVLVIRTPEGVSNVSFAGLRCSDRGWKDYAYARADQTWFIDKDSDWRQIQQLSFNDFRNTLYQDYFCVGGVMSTEPAGDSSKLVKLLKNPPVQDPRTPRKG
jgi:hypothetical protein